MIVMNKKKNKIIYVVIFLLLIVFGVLIKILCFPSEFIAMSKLNYRLKQISSVQGKLIGNFSEKNENETSVFFYDGEFVYVPGMTSKATWCVECSVNNSDSVCLTTYETYWQAAADRLFVKSNDAWSGYQHASSLLSSDWWRDQLACWEYKGVMSYHDKKYGCLSKNYSEDELLQLFHYVPLFPYGTIKNAETNVNVSLFFSIVTGKPVFCEFSFGFDNPLEVKYTEKTVFVSDGCIRLFFTDFSETDLISVPDEGQNVDFVSIERMFGSSNEESNTRLDGLISQDKKWECGFLSNRTYDIQTLNDNSLIIQTSDNISGKPFWSFSFVQYEDVYTDCVSNRNTALSYFNTQENLKDIGVSDVKQSFVGGYPCYWYSQEYSETSQGFLYQDYCLYVDLGYGLAFKGVLSAMTDLGDANPLSDDMFLDMLPNVWIESAVDE